MASYLPETAKLKFWSNPATPLHTETAMHYPVNEPFRNETSALKTSTIEIISSEKREEHRGGKIPKTPLAPQTESISIVGLGYVGAVSAACFAWEGYSIVGVDKDEAKLKTMAAGKAAIVEPHLSQMLDQAVTRHMFRTTTNMTQAIHETNITLVSVGTPSRYDGSCQLDYLIEATREIAAALQHKTDYHVIVYRSTIPPKTVSDTLKPILEKTSSKIAGQDFGLCFHPEFLRESTAIADFYTPPKTVIGAIDERSARCLGQLYQNIDENILYTSIEIAEMVKYTDNVWHANKVCFANEIGSICQGLGLDSHEVMNIFCQDTKLNLSPYYLKPGFAYGGSCLPKDTRAMKKMGENLKLDLPLIGSIANSNQAQIKRAHDFILRSDPKKVGILGLTFKPGTDDLRESPIITLIKMLQASDIDCTIYDENINSNKGLDIDCVFADSPGQILQHCDTVVIAHKSNKWRGMVAENFHKNTVIDLVRLFDVSFEQKAKEAGMDMTLQKATHADELLTSLQKLGDVPKSEMNVLLVEDNPVARRITQAMLEKAGHKLDTVCSGHLAVEQARMSDYDVILMDIEMPGIDGFEATRRIRSIDGPRSRVPVVALSAHTKPETANSYQGLCW